MGLSLIFYLDKLCGLLLLSLIIFKSCFVSPFDLVPQTTFSLLLTLYKLLRPHLVALQFPPFLFLSLRSYFFHVVVQSLALLRGELRESSLSLCFAEFCQPALAPNLQRCCVGMACCDIKPSGRSTFRRTR